MGCLFLLVLITIIGCTFWLMLEMDWHTETVLRALKAEATLEHQPKPVKPKPKGKGDLADIGPIPNPVDYPVTYPVRIISLMDTGGKAQRGNEGSLRVQESASSPVLK